VTRLSRLSQVTAVLVLPGALALACGGASGASAASGIVGYVHTLAKSRFPIGTIESETDEFGMHKITGTNGVFATEIASQAATAIPDFAVPILGGKYYPGGYAAQNPVVVAYLTDAGLPADQILQVTNNETGVVPFPSGSAAPSGDAGDQSVAAWFTILQRGYDGIPIEDSTAYAILGADGASLEEQVFWPAMGDDVVAEIRKFRVVLANQGARAKFLARLPDDLLDGQLRVHHTSWDWKGQFEAHACYGGTLGGESLCFDLTGQLVQLGDEAPASGS